MLNFVEVMALYRAFKVGRFKCSCASPKITVSEVLSEGYAIAIRKDSTKKFCLQCIQDFVENKSLRIVESKNYLTIYSPRDLANQL